MAYKLLGKTQIAVDHLHMHYISAIYNTALNIVHMYVTTSEVMDTTDNTKKIYKNMCLVSRSSMKTNKLYFVINSSASIRNPSYRV